MLLVSILLAITWRTTNGHSDLSDSTEIKAMELNPFYDTIIFNDIADIMNDMDVKFGGQQFETTVKNESQEDDDEDVLDLLSEYQHYLDRAHKQIKTYFEKSKTKNKVPLIRKDKFTKSKPMPSNIYDHQTSFYTGNNSPIDFFVPINPNLSFLHGPELAPFQAKGTQELFNLQKLMDDIYKPPSMPFYLDEGIKSCSCKNSEDCKRCLMPLGRISVNNNGGLDRVPPVPDSNMFLATDDLTLDKKADDSLNIRVKVDIEMPKLFDIFGKLMKNFTRENAPDNSQNLYKHGIYSSGYDFPFAMQMFGAKNAKINQYDVTPLRSLTLHKKKKQRPSISNKKHRKKLITFHNYKLEPQRSLKTIFIQNYNTSDNLTLENKTISSGNNTLLSSVNATQDYDRHLESNSTDKNNNTSNIETQTAESIFLMVNISNNLDSSTNDGKIINSIETETGFNLTTSKPNILRKRRDITSSNDTSHNNYNLTKISPTNISQVNDSKEARPPVKKEKDISLSDSELLYWPATTTNESNTGHIYNITAIILEKENKKAKLNISKDLVKNNRTEALQQAIFGDVDWNDVDAVAPAFLSFVGKYIDGILTFCSQNTCHSMKCAEKTCFHRICTPEQRINRKGHCIGSNSTESVVSMESIMDLPSNVAFEVVDILESKMLGRLFGKATVCIGNKCITFMASKKNFMKTKCSSKELNIIGHCSNPKNTKLV